MSYEKVKQAKNLKIGTKQTIKAIKSGAARTVVIARDADTKIVSEITELAEEHGVQTEYVDSMKKLGEASGIEVRAAAVTILD